MKNSQRAGSQDDRAGTGRLRRWWTGDKLSVRLFEVAFFLVLTGALAWDGWFASASQNVTWTPALVPPARPYPLIAPFRELRVLALPAAAGGAGVCAVVMRGAGWGQRLGPAPGRAVRFVMGGLGGCHRDW